MNLNRNSNFPQGKIGISVEVHPNRFDEVQRSSSLQVLANSSQQGCSCTWSLVCPNISSPENKFLKKSATIGLKNPRNVKRMKMNQRRRMIWIPISSSLS